MVKIYNSNLLTAEKELISHVSNSYYNLQVGRRQRS